MQKILLFLMLPLLLLATPQKVSLQFEWKHQFEYAGFYVAKEMGYYKNIGLDVTFKEYNNGLNISDDVIAGKSTFGISSSSLLLNKIKGKPVVLLASYFKQNALAIVAKKSIKTLKDLKHKKIMLTTYERDNTALGAMLQNGGLTKESYTLVPHTFSIKKFLDGEVDAMSVFLTNQPYLLNKKNVEYTVFNPADYGFYSYDLELFTSQKFAREHAKTVKDFIEATRKGWQYAFSHKKEVVKLIYNKYTQKKSQEALLYEAVTTEKFFKPQLFHIGAIIDELLELNLRLYEKFGVIHENVQIKNLLPNYVFGVTQAPLRNKIVTNKLITKPFLSQKEKKYLQKKEITMCIDPDWMPYEEFYRGKHKGITADYFTLVSKKLNTPIKVIYTHSWSESLEYAKSKKCDIMSLVMPTEERKKYLNFTNAYLKVPLVLATKLYVPFIENLHQVGDKKIAVVQGYAFEEILKNKYPNLHIVTVSSVEEGLKLVKRKKVFAYAGTLSSVAYMFQTKFPGELKIAAILQEKWNLGIGVRKDDALLLSIMNQVIKSIDEKEVDKIVHSWVAVKYETKADMTLAWQVILGLLLLIAGVLYWIKRLATLNKALNIAKKKSDELANVKTNFLANVSHEIRTPMNSIVGVSYLLKETVLSKIQFEYIQKIEQASQSLLQIINEILDYSKLEAHKEKLQNNNFHLLELLNKVENILSLQAYEKSLSFQTKYDKNNTTQLYGDEQKISQILTNFISNAVKFTDKGTITIAVEHEDNLYKFSVSDTGIGLTQEQQETIFDAFVQVDNSSTRKYRGTGLGLAISKEQVALMGGTIGIESHLDVGSTFFFEVTLPEAQTQIPIQETEVIKSQNEIKPFLDKEETQALFAQLKEAIQRRRPQLCNPIMQELQSYQLSPENEALLKHITNLVKHYKFDDARKIL